MISFSVLWVPNKIKENLKFSLLIYYQFNKINQIEIAGFIIDEESKIQIFSSIVEKILDYEARLKEFVNQNNVQKHFDYETIVEKRKKPQAL